MTKEQIIEEQAIEDQIKESLNKIPDNAIMLPKKTNLIRLIQSVYRLSKPVNYGQTNYVPGDLPSSEARQILSRLPEDSPMALSMGEVNGRICKMDVIRTIDGGLYIQDTWPNHTLKEFRDFLKSVGVNIKKAQAHGDEGDVKENRKKNNFSMQPGDEE